METLTEEQHEVLKLLKPVDYSQIKPDVFGLIESRDVGGLLGERSFGKVCSILGNFECADTVILRSLEKRGFLSLAIEKIEGRTEGFVSVPLYRLTEKGKDFLADPKIKLPQKTIEKTIEKSLERINGQMYLFQEENI